MPNKLRLFLTAAILSASLSTVPTQAQETDYSSWNNEHLLVSSARDIEQGGNGGAPFIELKRRMGEERATVALSETFEKGEGVTEQPHLAFSLLQALADKSSLTKGKTRSDKTSAPLYREAVFEYACMLMDGYGCQPDMGKAIQLFIGCAESGYKPALRELSLVSKEQGLTINDDYLQFLMREGHHYDVLNRMANGYIQVEKDNRHGIIDRQGKVIVPTLYDEPIHYQPYGLTAVVRNSLYGFVSQHGTEIISPRYLSASEFSEGIAIVYDSDGWAILDTEGNERLIDDFDAVGSFSDGLAIVKKNNLQGAIDHSGRIVIQPHYEELQAFSCGLAAVRKGKKWGYVDHNGNVVIDFDYDEATPFVNPKNPFALVKHKGKEICINKKGKKTKVK